MPSLKGVEPNLSTFKPKHLELIKLSTDPTIKYLMAAGGIRSGKSITLATIVYFRALRAPGSRHGIFHAYANTCYRNLFSLTIPETLEILQPGWFADLRGDKNNLYVNKSDHIITLPNGSMIIFGGLDDADKWRGTKFSTVWINEANQVDYDTVTTMQGRLSEAVPTLNPATGKQDGPPLDTKLLIDLNPTVKSSWEYQVFVKGMIPGDQSPIVDHASEYRWMHVNPKDNAGNLPPDYFKLFNSMSAEKRKRDEQGLWAEDNPNALFTAAKIGRKTVEPDDLVEIVVSLDPAGTDNAKSDSTGLIVAGRGYDDQLYVLDDQTFKAKPDVWIKRAVTLQKEYDANWIISEKDYARDILVELILRVAPSAPIKYVESRGRKKRLRAEPIAALYEQGRVNHVKPFPELELQMMEFDSPNFKGSPDRVDALVYALQHLSGEKPPAPVSIGRVKNFMG